MVNRKAGIVCRECMFLTTDVMDSSSVVNEFERRSGTIHFAPRLPAVGACVNVFEIGDIHLGYVLWTGILFAQVEQVRSWQYWQSSLEKGEPLVLCNYVFVYLFIPADIVIMTVLCHISPLADHLTENFEARHTFISIKQLGIVPKNISAKPLLRDPKALARRVKAWQNKGKLLDTEQMNYKVSGLHSEWDGGAGRGNCWDNDLEMTTYGICISHQYFWFTADS